MDMRKFQQMKSEILRKLNASVYTDKSPKGFLDAPIVELVNLLNSHKDYVTTSSCSGRIVLYATLEKKWILAEHKSVQFDTVILALEKYKSETQANLHIDNDFPILFKHEPFIMHVQCSSLESAENLLHVALKAGYRESGIVLGKKIIVAVRTTAGILEVPLDLHTFKTTQDNAATDERALPFLQYIVKQACVRFDENKKRSDNFMKMLQQTLLCDSRCINALSCDSPTTGSALCDFESGFTIDRLKRWSHATAETLDCNYVLTFGGYGIAKDGHVGRLNDFVYGYWNKITKRLTWGAFDDKAAHDQIWPSVRVRHTLTALPPLETSRIHATTNAYYGVPCILFGGRKGPFEPTNEVLVAIFSHHSPGPDYTRQFNLAWSALEMKSLKHEFPRKRWSHSATLLEAKGDYETYANYNNDEMVQTICVYGGRNNSEVFDDLFFLNIYCDQYANDRKDVCTSVHSMPSDIDYGSSKQTMFGWWEPATGKCTGAPPGPRFSHTSTFISKKSSQSTMSLVIAGGYVSTDDTSLAYANSLHLLDLHTMAWSSIFSSDTIFEPALRYSHTASCFDGNKILLLGGIRRGANCGNMLIFDADQCSFSVVENDTVDLTLVRHTMSTLVIEDDEKKDFQKSIFIKIGGGSQVSSFGQAWNDPPISWFDVQSLEQVSLGVIETASGDNARAERQNRSNSSKKSVEAKSVSISALAVDSRNIKLVKIALEKVNGLNLNYRITSADKCKNLLNTDKKYASKKLLPLTDSCSDKILKKYTSKDGAINVEDYLGQSVQLLFRDGSCFFLHQKLDSKNFLSTKVPRNMKKNNKKSLVNVLRDILEKYSVKDKIPHLLALVPSKFEKLGPDVTVLPKEMFIGRREEPHLVSNISEAKYDHEEPLSWKNSLSQECLDEVYRQVSEVQKTSRVLCRYEVGTGIMRKSCAKLLYDKHKSGSWLKIRENGIVYNFDCEKVMFCTGNGTEKRRMGGKGEGEVIVDLYAGIGYFTLPFLVHGRATHVHACEINPDSVEALKKNLVENAVEDRCTVYLGDNAISGKKLIGLADRVNLGLLPDSIKGYAIAVDCLNPKSGGILHVHGNCSSAKKKEWGKKVEQDIYNIAQEQDKPCSERFNHVKCVHVERVKSYAPRVDHVVADIEVRYVA